jgi:hypothetical protein
LWKLLKNTFTTVIEIIVNINPPNANVIMVLLWKLPSFLLKNPAAYKSQIISVTISLGSKYEKSFIAAGSQIIPMHIVTVKKINPKVIAVKASCSSRRSEGMRL